MRTCNLYVERQSSFKNPGSKSCLNIRHLSICRSCATEYIVFRLGAIRWKHAKCNKVTVRCHDDAYDEIIAEEYENEAREEYFIASCTVRASEKKVAMKYLRERGITKESLKPDENDAGLLALRKEIPRLLEQYRIECIPGRLPNR